MKTTAAGAAGLAVSTPAAGLARARRAQDEPRPLQLGIIGLDTSHVIAFTALLNDSSNPHHIPGARVVRAYKGGSPDVEASATRIEKFTAELTSRWNVTLVPSIEELCEQVDAVLLSSVDGRTHLPQVRPVIEARKPVFIDKPFTASLRDAQEIVRLARERDAPIFSSSALRFSDDVVALTREGRAGTVLGASTFGPAPTEPHHPDLFWYGIHSVEMLYTLLGPGCARVTRTHTDGADVVVGQWKDGRLGVVRGIREGEASYGAVVFGSEGVVGSPSLVQSAPSSASTKKDARPMYHGLVTAIVEFLRTGTPPVAPEETLEIIAFMDAAESSKSQNGSPVEVRG
ncbi:MAG: gfo/Idh/MocA family oxidoreductase [Luteitalea sp.]|nr:gfo/Idh/MocA family oxidoreductase [Luteitalea sp.]